MDKTSEPVLSIKRLGGRISLDFVNTVAWHGIKDSQEYITGYRELVLWGGHVGILSDREMERLLRQSGRRPAEAAKVHKSALKLRGAIHRIFSSVYRGEEPSQSDLEIFNTALSAAMSRMDIKMEQGNFLWGWKETEHQLDRVLWPVVKDAAELLTSKEIDRVCECGDEKCGWLFLDTSRNRSRRWCAMEDCGNRAKVRRHYQKSQR
jgi:predicted RNA-binding Zn ribbon-like protein